ncbi:hypothetical protein KP509_39G013200 [Ceratopteris richardii]|uniref:Uncharacterized protein n=1 Tax=Ceratopteris richardii TaxID=49495 RepID=A0A8T2PZB0_CERRI|nr:hypothetical protein KP509_39G013200 [Ceratopteris richardii]
MSLYSHLLRPCPPPDKYMGIEANFYRILLSALCILPRSSEATFSRPHHSSNADRVTPVTAFKAEAPIGTVECYSQGCRPLYEDDDDACSALYSPAEQVDGATLATAGSGIPSVVLSSCDVQRILDSGGPWSDAERAQSYYEAVEAVEPRNWQLLLEHALFAWKVLGDCRRADGLFRRAMSLAPSNASVVAFHASFLWQTEDDW